MRSVMVSAVFVIGCGEVDGGEQNVRDAAGTAVADAADADVAVATCAPAPAGLRARYRAENNASDHAGNFDGTAVGVNFSYAAGKYGAAFQLDGVDDAVTINDGDQLWPTGSFTLEAWIKTAGTSPGGIIVCKYACGAFCPNSSAEADLCMYTDAGGHPAFEFRPDAPTENVTIVTATLVTVTDGAWHHLVGVRDSQAMAASLYIDGTLATAASPAAAQFGPMTNKDNEVDLVTIGANVIAGQQGLHGWFAGAIDEVAIYDSALSATQVAAIHGAPDGKCL